VELFENYEDAELQQPYIDSRGRSYGTTGDKDARAHSHPLGLGWQEDVEAEYPSHSLGRGAPSLCLEGS
jgi:hypothetical protein